MLTTAVLDIYSFLLSVLHIYTILPVREPLLFCSFSCAFTGLFQLPFGAFAALGAITALGAVAALLSHRSFELLWPFIAITALGAVVAVA